MLPSPMTATTWRSFSPFSAAATAMPRAAEIEFDDIGGGLYAHITNFINPTDFSYHKVVQILLFPVFGGSNVVWGSVLGSFILTLLPEVLRFLSDYRDIIYGALLVILMAVRPDGILTESMVDKISRKLGFKKAPYIPESQVLTERFEAYKRKQEEKQG